MGMFGTALMILMALAILVLVVLVIYLADRFNGLERETQALIQSLKDSKAASASGAAASGPYAGLSGKALWEAVTGQASGGLDELTLDGVRKRYRALIGEHISQIFSQGAEDQARNIDSVPASSRIIRTPRAQVESWLPGEAVEAIYRCGQAFARNDPAELPGVRQRLDQACAALQVEAGLEVLQPASQVLMAG
ncbi:hypothetical protein ACT80S_12170 [Ramlibacter sp. MAHUQ-53]